MIFDKISEIIVSQLGFDESEITMETAFKEDLGIASVDLYELVMILEEEYGIELPQESLGEIETIEDIVKLLKEMGVEE